VNADAQLRIGASYFESGSEGEAVGEQGGAGYQAFAMSLGDATVDAFGPTEVVSVDDKALHFASLSCPKGQLSFVGMAASVPLTVIPSNFSMTR
jgi:hypothetical protein